MNPVKNNEISGTTGRALRVEAIKISLGNSLSSDNDIYYRSHVADIGWLGWAKNGEMSGTAGGCKRMEAIEIRILPKGSTPPGSTDTAFYDYNNKKHSPSRNGALKVIGNKLTDQAGKPVQLRGVSTHGIGWFPQYVNQPLFTELHNNWNANLVRLALYTAESNGYCTGGDQIALRNLVKSGIEYASNADMYVIVDWHVLSDQDPRIYKEEAKHFFNDISSSYRGNNNVIYEICNEPNGNTDWNAIKSYALEIIPVIRANDPDAVIIVGTPTWSQDVDQAVLNPITEYNNIMYAFHFYAGTHKQDLRNKMVNSYNAGLPIFVTEFGTTDASGNGGLDLASANEWMSVINANNISYACWNLSNKNESSALINSSCNKTSGFSNSDLSGQGQWLLTALASSGLPNTTPSTPGTPDTPNTPDTSGKVNYTLSLVNSWGSGNESYYQYTLKITNNSSRPIESWSKDITFNQTVEVNNNWNSRITANGRTLSIHNESYNGVLNSGESTEAGFILKSSAGLKEE